MAIDLSNYFKGHKMTFFYIFLYFMLRIKNYLIK